MTRDFSYLPEGPKGSPYLILAPMEGVGDRAFRRAMASVGGFNEAVQDFLRVPKNAHVESLSREYDAQELGSLPLACQIMGSDLELMAAMAQEIEKKGAPRLDINCGCPSKIVTGRGAGSSLLQDPEFLHQVVKAVVQAVNIPVTVKMRSGYDDTSLFHENLRAAEEGGIAYLTLHPRTKADGYGPPADWSLIAEAKRVLTIPVVGNGDIITAEDAHKMHMETRCDALMIGRGAVGNPFIFQEILALYEGRDFCGHDYANFFDVFLREIPSDTTIKVRINKVKQLLSLMFKRTERLLEQRTRMLVAHVDSPEELVGYALPFLRESSSKRK